MKASPKEEEMKNIRKGLFICTMVALTLLFSLNSAWAPGDARTYVTGNLFLTLDGVKCGFVKSVDGGGISAEVINESAGPAYFTRKHIGQPKYEDFTMQVGFGMTKGVYEWISQTWNWQIPIPSKNGSIISADYSLNAKSEQQFFNALLTETTIPAMDGSSKEAAYITLKFAPEYTRLVKSSGKLTGDYKIDQKMFLPSNFILKIDGLDCSKVNKIESFTVKQAAVKDNIGDARDSQKQPGKLNFPNLKITMAEVAAQSFLDWHDSFVIKGNNDDSKEKNGSLTLLSPDRKTEIAKIEFFNMGIFRIQPDKAQANADQIKRLTVELYVERMTFKVQSPKY